MGTLVVVEPYKGKKGPSQCHNCQGWFHSAQFCNLPLSAWNALSLTQLVTAKKDIWHHVGDVTVEADTHPTTISVNSTPKLA